jgi:hypothetical protein
MDPLGRFLEAPRPLLREHRAQAGYRIGSRTRGTASDRSDSDVIVVTESDRLEVERLEDYLPAILALPALRERYFAQACFVAQLSDDDGVSPEPRWEQGCPLAR